ncbi:hypothetical protein INR49_017626 [Caranx melampygus]|nr:hypothetical protein INR49_017626 [Caranx melampygus]
MTVMRWKTVSAIFFLVVLYLIIGATVFRALEQPQESLQKLAILEEKLKFLATHACVNTSELEDLVKVAVWCQIGLSHSKLQSGGRSTRVTPTAFPRTHTQETLMHITNHLVFFSPPHTTLPQVVSAVRAGVNPSGNSFNQTSLWDLSSSFFFAGTVITTIGFGNISPHTEGGRIFCIIYALLGIPLFGFLLAGVGDQLGTIFGKGIARVEKMIVKWKVSQTKIRVISTLLFILFGCLIFVALPAVIFKHIEGWSTLESIYFVVITLTTIGFGDFVAAGGSETADYLNYYKPVVLLWILVGLAYFAAVLSMIGDWFRVISKKTKEEVGEFRAHAAEWTANVSAEFKETRRRLSVDIYDKFQRAASIKRKLSSELGINTAINQEITPSKRTLSANLCEDREAYPNLTLSLSPVPGSMARNGNLYLNGLSPDYADRREIAIIENLK